jgi:hypothetical protein
MKRTILRRWIPGLALLVLVPAAYGQLFEADSKRYGKSNTDIVIKEVERRPKSSVIEMKITSVGSSVGSSLTVACMLYQLAQVRGNYRYMIKIDERVRNRQQMLIGFLSNPEEKPADIDPEFAQAGGGVAVVDFDVFGEKFKETCRS